MNNQNTSHTIQLGQTGARIKPLGIGTWAWGDRIVWGYGRGGYSDQDLQQAFQACLDAGVTAFDTAEVYGSGRSEKNLGKFIQTTGQQITILTKFMPYPWRLTRASLLKALRRSLDRFGVSQVDLYQMHWPLPPLSVETWMDAMAEAVNAGLVKQVGVSNYSVEQTIRAQKALEKHGHSLASNQVEYSLLHRAPEHDGLMDLCRDSGITLIAYSPLAQGLLTGKYSLENPPPGTRGRRISQHKLRETTSLVKLMRRIGEAHNGKTPAQVALNWLICKGTLPIPGVKNLRQAAENLGALGWRLTEEQIAQLEQASNQLVD